jgi:hypothetical protein
MVNEPTATISSLAHASCNELFDADADAEREYCAWLDEREQEWDRTIAAADAL